jgi:hypothetical protein
MWVEKKKKNVGRAGRVAQVVEHLPSKCEALSSNLNTGKKKVCWELVASLYVILATQGAEIMRITVQTQPHANSS